MVWDFTEVNPLVDAAGDLTVSLRGIAKTIIGSTLPAVQGIVNQRDAVEAELPVNPIAVSTDPPYYDNIGYSDLSDFFYVWLRHSLARVYPSLLSTMLTPKVQELIASQHRHGNDRDKAKEFFELGFGKCFQRIQRGLIEDVPLTVFYAFRQSESDDDDEEHDLQTSATSSGWETMLEGLVKSGFTICGTWPIRTERGSRMRDFGSNALASSIVLVCRARAVDAPLATRKDFMTALRQELPNALKNLQQGNIAPVDLAQAAIGPGMSVFTRYAKSIESDGSPMTVRTALGIINQVLDEVLAEQEGELDADTRWALAWFDQYGAQEGPFGDAETFCKAKNTAINGLVEAGVVKAKGGKVQLTGRSQLPKGWDRLGTSG